MLSFSFNDVYGIIKALRDLVQEYHDAAMSEKLAEIQNYFFDIREEMENIKEENRALKLENEQLKASNVLEEDLELTTHGYYIRKSEQAQGKDVRYCPACWQNYKKLMPIVNTIANAKQCTNCHTVIR